MKPTLFIFFYITIMFNTIGLNQTHADSSSVHDFSYARYCHKVIKIVQLILAKSTKSNSLAKRACMEGDGEAFYKLSKLAQIHINSYASDKLSRIGCDKNSYNSCISLAKNLKQQNRDGESKILLVKACTLKASEGCARLGIFYNRNKKYKLAIKAFKRSSEAGDKESCYMIGRIQDKQGKKSQAIKKFSACCEKFNSSRSCLMSGKLQTDKKVKKYYLKKSCELSSKEGCYLLKQIENG